MSALKRTRPRLIGYPYCQLSSHIFLKFMPQIPARRYGRAGVVSDRRLRRHSADQAWKGFRQDTTHATSSPTLTRSTAKHARQNRLKPPAVRIVARVGGAYRTCEASAGVHLKAQLGQSPIARDATSEQFSGVERDITASVREAVRLQVHIDDQALSRPIVIYGT
jgi:hypothetical protein